MHGFQVWVNLPAKDKMIEPRYQEFTADQIPRCSTTTASTVRVIAGKVERVRGRGRRRARR